MRFYVGKVGLHKTVDDTQDVIDSFFSVFVPKMVTFG